MKLPEDLSPEETIAYFKSAMRHDVKEALRDVLYRFSYDGVALERATAAVILAINSDWIPPRAIPPHSDNCCGGSGC